MMLVFGLSSNKCFKVCDVTGWRSIDFIVALDVQEVSTSRGLGFHAHVAVAPLGRDRGMFRFDV